MNMQTKKNKKLPHGYCSDIADIVGTDRFYVSKILRNPKKFNGDLANQVKETAEKIEAFKENFKTALANAAIQN